LQLEKIMTDAVTPEFLSHLTALYPASSSGGDNTWAFVAAVAFSASNLPEAVPLVFQHAALSITEDEDSLLLVRKMKDAMFKSGMLSGYPKVGSFPSPGYSPAKHKTQAINALMALHNALPENLRDKKPLRYLPILFILSVASDGRRSSDHSMSTEALNKAGNKLFNHTYGDTAEAVQTMLNDTYPDLCKSRKCLLITSTLINRVVIRVLLGCFRLWLRLFLLGSAIVCRHRICNDCRAYSDGYTSSD
jgi:hypothetical protein